MAVIRVIVPVYKAERYLRRCVDSILTQSFSDFELVLVDDGSPDQCSLICDEYAAKDSRVHAIHQENMGVAAARNSGIFWCADVSDYEWITFVDSDDMIHPQMLEFLYRAAVENHADLAMCGAVEAASVPDGFLSDRQPGISAHKVDEDYILDLYCHGKHRYWTAWAKLVKRSLAESLPFEVGRIYEDNNLIFQWISSSKLAADMDEDLYYYAVNDEGITKSLFSVKQLDYPRALKKQIAYYQKKKYKKIHQILCEKYIRDAAQIYLKAKKQTGNMDSVRKFRRENLRFWLFNYSRIPFSKDEFLYHFGIFCPHMIQLYWLIKSAADSVRRFGIRGMVEKVRDRLVRSDKR